MTMPSIREAVELIYDMMNRNDLSNMDEVVAKDLIDHEEMPGVTGSGSERLAQFVAMFHSAFSDLKMTPLDTIIEGDRAAVRFNVSGKHTGDALGFPATGKSISIEGIDILHFANGKVTEHWGISDQVGLMMQLGMMPGA
jgi:steroid delta-isomerase-like uncharacterized protein